MAKDVTQGHLNNSTMGRVMMICLDGLISEKLLKELIKKLKSRPDWKPLFMRIRSNVVDVSPELVFVLRNVLGGFVLIEKWMGGGNMSPHCFAHLLEHLIIRESLSSLFFTTRSCFVRLISHMDSMSSLTSQPPETLSHETRNLIVDLVEHVLKNKEFTLSWIKKSNMDLSDMDSSRYHELFLLRMFMILSLLVLKEGSSDSYYVEAISKLLRCKEDNIADLLPANVVSNLVRLSNNKPELNFEVIAQAFATVDDPLLIVWSGNENPNIDAPCAIFVDLQKCEEDIMSLVFARRNTGVKMIPVCSKVNWKFLLDMSAFLIDGKNGEELSLSFTQISENLMKTLETLATIMEDGDSSDIIDSAFNDLTTLETYITLSKQGLDRTLFLKDIETLVKRLKDSRQLIDVR